EPGVADQLGEDSTWAEGDERPEDGVLDGDGEELGAAADVRLHDDGRPDPLDGGAHVVLLRETEGDAAALRLVGARLRGLDDDGEPELARGCDGLVGGRGETLRHDRDAVRLEQRSGGGRFEPALARLVDDPPRRDVVDSLQVSEDAGGAA